MQAYAACDDPELREVVRQGFGDLVAYAERVSGLPPEEVARFFATGMLLNVFASMGQIGEDAEPWALRLLEALRDKHESFFFDAEVSDESQTKSNHKLLWAFVLTSVAGFMVTLDNLVVTTALPGDPHDLGAGLDGLEWTVNAYTLTFAVLLLTGAALGDRFGRRRLLAIGLALFTASSAAAALAPSIGALDAARALQGIGGAIVMPLTLTILSAAVPAERRGLALGAWGGITGLAVAFGPLVGGAVVSGISWQWIFWLNVPIGLVLVPLVLLRLDESRGPWDRLDLPGPRARRRRPARDRLGPRARERARLGLARDHRRDPGRLRRDGAVRRSGSCARRAPMLPMRFFRNRAFALANAASLFFSFGMFGSIFLLAQFFQTVQGYSPLGSGLRILPWTAMPMIVAPIAGALSDRIGGHRLMGAGLALQAIGLAWIAAISTPTMPYVDVVRPFTISGVGMALFFAPVANVVLSSVRPVEQGQASGANNAIRELGGVLGVAVLASIFAHDGGYDTAETFVNGMNAAVYVGAAVVGVGAVAAFLIRPLRWRRAEVVERPAELELAA